MNKLDIALNISQYVNALQQSDETMKIVSLIISILTTVVLVVFRIISWFHEAKADGKITKDELKELKEQLKDDGIEVIDLRELTTHNKGDGNNDQEK